MVVLADSTVTTTVQKDDSEALQNAESSSIPREIPVGLPESGTGSTITEEGLRLSHAMIRDYFHWAGGNSYGTTRIMGLTESLIKTGDVAMAVDSRTKTGTDIFSGAFSGRTSTNGLIRFDGNISGPAGGGWYYSLGANVNFDPTSVNAPTRKYVDKKMIFKAAITRRWKAAEFDLMGKLSMCSDNPGNAYSKAPFIYNGDGTIDLYNGFRLGRDCYFPADDFVSYKDVVTGETREGYLSEMDDKVLLDINSNFRFRLDDGWTLVSNLHLCTTPKFSSAENAMGGVVKASSAAYTIEGGASCPTEYVQLRLVTPHVMKAVDFMGRFYAERRSASNTLELGSVVGIARQSQHTSTFYYGHTVEANPQRVLLNGNATWNLNGNALYYDANLFNLTLYATDEWSATDKLFFRTGLRVMAPFYTTWNLANTIVDGTLTTKYNRYDGFSIKDLNDKGIRTNRMTEKDIDGLPLDISVSGYSSYRLSGSWMTLAEAFYCRSNKTPSQFKGNKIPSMKAIGYAFARAGFSYEDEWEKGRKVSASLVGSYISSWNNSGFGTISNPTRTMQNSYVFEYGIRTLGINFDGNLQMDGFNLHALVTWQDPRYRDYEHTEHFSDGSTTAVVFSGNYVTSISKWRVEIDPSYSWKKLKVTANLRYISRQYASKNNLAYFNGHFETFGSASYRINRFCSLSLNIVNALFQTGANGSVAASDAAKSEADLAGLVMCGSYIRPFTVDLGLSLKF